MHMAPTLGRVIAVIPALQLGLLLMAGIHVLPSWQAVLPEEALTPRDLPEEVLMEIFIGRCSDFQLVLHPELFPELKNCSHLWETFHSTALGSGSCLPDPADFNELMALADHTVPTGKFVFWSGVYDLIEKLKELPGYFPIDNTLMGHTMNSLEWCGRECNSSSSARAISQQHQHQQQHQQQHITGWQPDVASSAERQGAESCSNFTLPFWVAASQWFAAKALGPASVVLNASVESPFRETSIFGKHELPNISPTRVTQMDIYMVNSLSDADPSGSCGSTSVQRLKLLLHRKDIRATCTENPAFLMHILCADQPESERCRHIGGSSGRLAPSFLWTTATSSGLAAVALGLGGILQHA